MAPQQVPLKENCGNCKYCHPNPEKNILECWGLLPVMYDNRAHTRPVEVDTDDYICYVYKKA
jgi:hypothetical protein